MQFVISLIVAFFVSNFTAQANERTQLPVGHLLVGSNEDGKVVAAIVPGVFQGMVGVGYEYADEEAIQEIIDSYEEKGFEVHDVRPRSLTAPGRLGSIDPATYIADKLFSEITNAQEIRYFLLFLIKDAWVGQYANCLELCQNKTCRLYTNENWLEIKEAKDELLEKYSISWYEDFSRECAPRVSLN